MSLLPTPVPRILSKFDNHAAVNRSSGLYSSRQDCGSRPPSRRSWRRGCRQGRKSTTCLLAGSARPPNGGSPVRVYELGKAQSKRVVAEALVHAPVEQVWAVLTDYDRLAGFVPNLESCKRLPCPKPGRVWVVQRACSQSLLWRLEAEAVLEVEEVVESEEGGGMGRREARFSQVQGDFKELSGRWVVEPCGMACMLRYDVTLVPKQDMPLMLVNHIVRAGLPSNILAVAQRAEQLAAERLKPPSIASWALEDDAPIPETFLLAGEGQPSGSQLQQQQEQQEGALACAFSPPPGLEEQEACVEGEGDREGEGLVLSSAAGQPTSVAAGTAAVGAAAAALPWPSGGDPDEVLPSCGPFWSFKSRFAASAPITAEAQRARLDPAAPPRPVATSYLGVVSVPLPPAGSRGGQLEQDLQATMNERQRQKEVLQASYPAFGLGRPGSLCSSSGASSSSSASASDGGSNGNGGGSAATSRRGVGVASGPGGGAGALPQLGSPVDAALAEVHLRRLDGWDYLHRRAVAAITIDAPPEEVWAVLTDYDHLAEFVPNLAVSQRIKLPPGAPPNVVRVRQVGYKRMLYMSMHAEAVMDLVEKPFSEIQFRQVAGDFERFQGKWMLSDCMPTDPEATGVGTQLKYAVEIVIPKAARLLGVMEPILERCVFEDMPANLRAVKRRVEWMQNERARTVQLQRIAELEAAGESSKAAALRKRLERPRQQELIEDFSVLAAELERCFGEQRYLPSRVEFREMGRYDLDKAVTAHGGPAAVAQALGWGRWGGRHRNRKPRGYWDSLDNIRAAIDEFNAEFGLRPGTMPAKMDLRRSGRKDIEKALEKWGGLYAVAEELGYAVGSGWVGHLRDVATTTGLAGNQGLFKEAAKTYKKLDASRDEGSAREAALASLSSSSSLSSMDAFSSMDVYGDSGSGLDGFGGGASAGEEATLVLAGACGRASAASAAAGSGAAGSGAAGNGAAGNGSQGAMEEGAGPSLEAGQLRQQRVPRAGSKAAAAAGANNGSSSDGNGSSGSGSSNAGSSSGGSRAGKGTAGSGTGVGGGRNKGEEGKGVHTIGSVRDEIDSW